MKLPDFDGVNQEPKSESAESANKLLERLEILLRTTWIEEWRRNYMRQHSKPSNYMPGPRLDGGVDSHGYSFEPIWPKFALFVHQHNLNPVSYIRAQFANCKSNPPVSPQMIMGPRALKRYEEYASSYEVEAELTLAREAQTRAARDALEHNKRLYGPGKTAYRATIVDDNVPLSALFRYMLSCSSGQTDLAEIWFEAALDQYMYESEAYDYVWGQLIPKTLREAARDMKALLAISKL